MNVRIESLAGNIIRQEPPVHLFSASISLDDEDGASLKWEDLMWDDRGRSFVTTESHPNLCEYLVGVAERRGWRVGVWPGSRMPISFTIHRQPEDWGGFSNHVSRL